jgi:hypothetical protein
MAQVSVDPVAKTCNPNSVKAKGANANTVFQITQDSTNAWIWQSTAITFKQTPPVGCFTITNPGNSGNLNVKSRNSQAGDYGTWSYSLFLKNTQTNATSTIDPDIVNEASNVAT